MAAPTKQELIVLVMDLAAHLDSYTKADAQRWSTARTPTIEEVLDRAVKAVPALKEIVR